MVQNSLSFCLSEKLLISPSYLNEILAGHIEGLGIFNMTDIAILESTYFDKCTIKRKEKIKNPNTGVTETKEIIIVEDVKCALSKKDIQTMNVDGVGALAFSHLLFLNPNVDVQEGDTVEVASMGKISTYLASKPFYYSSHSETLLTYKERA